MTSPSLSRTALAGLLLVGGGVMTSCMVGPDYETPLTEMPASYRYDSRKNGREAARRDDWWKVFHDGGLNRLISDVRSSNHDLKAGVKRVEQARAIVRLAAADAYPQLSASPSISRNRSSDEIAMGGGTGNLFSAPLSASWEIDLFGRIRRGVQAAAADAQASEESLNALRLSLEAEAASGYFNLRALDRQIQIVQSGVDSRQGSLQLVKDRNELGAVSSLDVSQAEALLASSEADLAGLRRQRTAQEAALAALAGRAASTYHIAADPLDGTPPSVPAGLPAELLRARPDIRGVERQLAAANERVGVATAAFYPSVSITGSLGFQAADFENLFNHGARFWGISPQVYVPVFQGGRNKANLAQSQARYEEVLETYQQTILDALAEVETRLSATRLLDTQNAAQARAVKASAQALSTAREQYKGGTTSYLNVLDAERTALDSERQQALLRGSDYINTVNLIRALGGRW
ncbi:efflux transporter outer membrane subunit [Haloferula sargassicola]|uniref:Toluene efflux pump outer membrane protein TtgI n=1 Tax=Haloferula sargassicola TaxID=490096 RepID=A0ABP9US17_9BACT